MFPLGPGLSEKNRTGVGLLATPITEGFSSEIAILKDSRDIVISSIPHVDMLIF